MRKDKEARAEYFRQRIYMVDWIKLAKAIFISFSALFIMIGFIALILLHPLVIGIIVLIFLLCFMVYIVYKGL